MHRFLIGMNRWDTVVMHRRLSMFASLDLTRVLLGPAWSLPSLPVDAPTGGAWFSSLTLAKRRLFSRYSTLTTASRTRARNGFGMHVAHRCRTRRNTDNFTFSYALTSNRSNINRLRDFGTTHNIYYVKLSRKMRKIPPPAPGRPGGSACARPHTRSPQILPPGTPLS
jgi:hypothetical protein